VPTETDVRGPRQVPAGKQDPGRVYLLSDDYYAEHGCPRGTSVPEAVLTLSGGEIMVFRRAPDQSPTRGRCGGEVGPVYASPDGPIAVPTGRLFVRFREGTSAAGRASDIERVGFEIEHVPGYAPHAAWVRARESGIAASLGGMASLEAIADVENVEPQMLMESARR
jgi:hypothetical protein